MSSEIEHRALGSRLAADSGLLVGSSVRGIMLAVSAALLPGMLVLCYQFGSAFAVNALLAVGSAAMTELLVARVRLARVRDALEDGTWLVTALLIAAGIPGTSDWWVPCVAVFIGLTLGKHCYGGLGRNVFNPAMVGYAFVLLCFPGQLAVWYPANAAVPATSDEASARSTDFFDALTTATPLDHARQQRISLPDEASVTLELPELLVQGLSTLGFLIGGLALLILRVIDWRIPLSVLVGLCLSATFGGYLEWGGGVGPVVHLLSGAAVLCAFFVATDPVSAPVHPMHQLVYGFAIGVIVYSIRTWGDYPDGVAFAVLSMNMFVPLLDRARSARVGHR